MADIHDIREGMPQFPKFQPKNLLVILAPIVLLVIAYTSFYTVKPEEEAVVLRFGKYVKTAGSGLNFKLPLGIDRVAKLPVRRQLELEFGTGRVSPSRFNNQSGQVDDVRSMVTGDTNAALVEWVIQYRISDPRNFLFNVRNPVETLSDASESVMREVVGDRTVDEVITIGRQEIESEVLDKLSTLVTKFELGVSIDQVQLQNVNPPEQVQASFNEVNEAEQQQKEAINLARGEYNRAVPRSRGEAEQRISEAEGYALQRINEAQGDAARFNSLFSEYKKAPEVTRQRLYLETMAEVIPNLGSKVIVDQNGQQVLPLLNLGGTTQPSSAVPAATLNR